MAAELLEHAAAAEAVHAHGAVERGGEDVRRVDGEGDARHALAVRLLEALQAAPRRDLPHLDAAALVACGNLRVGAVCGGAAVRRDERAGRGADGRHMRAMTRSITPPCGQSPGDPPLSVVAVVGLEGLSIRVGCVIQGGVGCCRFLAWMTYAWAYFQGAFRKNLPWQPASTANRRMHAVCVDRDTCMPYVWTETPPKGEMARAACLPFSVRVIRKSRRCDACVRPVLSAQTVRTWVGSLRSGVLQVFLDETCVSSAQPESSLRPRYRAETAAKQQCLGWVHTALLWQRFGLGKHLNIVPKTLQFRGLGGLPDTGPIYADMMGQTPQARVCHDSSRRMHSMPALSHRYNGSCNVAAEATADPGHMHASDHGG